MQKVLPYIRQKLDIFYLSSLQNDIHVEAQIHFHLMTEYVKHEFECMRKFCDFNKYDVDINFKYIHKNNMS